MLNSLKNLFGLLFLILGLASCSNNEKLDFSKPEMQIPKEQKILNQKKGSLYTRTGPSLFADKKDLQIGDIIQVQISESLSSDAKNEREVKRSGSTSLGGGLLSPITNNLLNSSVNRGVNDFNKTVGLDFKTSSSTSNKGEAKTKLNENFSTTVSVIIEQTYQNGNYYIKGSKEMLIDGQKQQLILSGVIRPYDITPENSVSSAQVANLKILYKKEGEERDILHVPWGLRIIQMFWPF